MKMLDNKSLEVVLRTALDAIEDTILELEQPEVIELTSMALDRKLASAQQSLTETLDNE